MLTALLSGTAHAQNSAATPPPSVVVATVEMKDVAKSDDFTGRVEAIQAVELLARVEGFLTNVNFTGGETVQAGTVLFQIEQAPYQAALDQANARLAAANANLLGAQAQLANAQIVLERQQVLVRSDTVSEAVLDSATADRDQANADVQAAKAQIDEAKADISTANLDLSYTTIAAPIIGQIGRPLITTGNLVSSRSDSLATLVQLDPIRVGFAVPEAQFVTLSQDAQTVSQATLENLLSPVLRLPNGKTYEHTGEVVFASNVVNTSTGTVTVYADFPNPNGLLLPGAFVVVTVQESQESDMLVVPATALLQDRQGPYVFAVNKDNVVEQRRIAIAQRTNAEVAVSSGLSKGETVIVQGVQKVTAGEKVTPTPQTQNTSTAQAAPNGNGTSPARN